MTLNILQASLLAMHRAVQLLTPQPTYVLVDGNHLPRWPYASEPVIKGDARVPAIAAASILAKVQRDAELAALDELYPGYGFARSQRISHGRSPAGAGQAGCDGGSSKKLSRR